MWFHVNMKKMVSDHESMHTGSLFLIIVIFFFWNNSSSKHYQEIASWLTFSANPHGYLLKWTAQQVSC